MLQETGNAIIKNSIIYQYFDIVNATNIISKTDSHGIITYANNKFLEISGYKEDELIGKSHNILRDPKLDKKLFEKMWSTLKSKKSWHGVITNLRKDGTRYTVNASIFPVINDMNEITEYIAIRHDITKIMELNSQIEKLNTYKIQQENIAREKLEAGIVNDMPEAICQVLYHPSDILSGDFYSIHKCNNNSIFIYVMDGQGHGIAPALTVFAISSMVNQLIKSMHSLHEIIDQFTPNIKNFLGEIEQLSYTLVMITPDKKKISYASAGMYPFLIKSDEKIIKIKANNTPFMNFSQTPDITDIDLESWDSLLIYSDGLVEHENDTIEHHTPKELIKNPSQLQESISEICSHRFDDDVTVLYLENKM